MANDDKNGSPFSALSFKAQQDQWMAWRSQHLSYEKAELEQEIEPAQTPAPARKEPPEKAAPAQMPSYIPPKHSELDRLRSKHMQAAKCAAYFQPIAKP